MNRYLLILLLLPCFCKAQDSAEYKYESYRCDEVNDIIFSIDDIPNHWIPAIVCTPDNKDSLEIYHMTVRVTNCRVDSIKLVNGLPSLARNRKYVTLKDTDVVVSGGYLSDVIDDYTTIIWTRFYLSKGNATQQFSIEIDIEYPDDDGE